MNVVTWLIELWHVSPDRMRVFLDSYGRATIGRQTEGISQNAWYELQDHGGEQYVRYQGRVQSYSICPMTR